MDLCLLFLTGNFAVVIYLFYCFFLSSVNFFVCPRIPVNVDVDTSFFPSISFYYFLSPADFGNLCFWQLDGCPRVYFNHYIFLYLLVLVGSSICTCFFFISQYPICSLWGILNTYCIIFSLVFNFISSDRVYCLYYSWVYQIIIYFPCQLIVSEGY